MEYSRKHIFANSQTMETEDFAIKLHVRMYSGGDARQMKKNEISEK